MKVTVVAFSSSEVKQTKEGLRKLQDGISEFRRDLSDSRIDVETVQAFVEGLRLTADYFEKFLQEDNSDLEPNES